MTRRSSHSYFGQKLKIQRVIPHPSYNQGIPHDNDIALFQVGAYFCIKMIQLLDFLFMYFFFHIILAQGEGEISRSLATSMHAQFND